MDILGYEIGYLEALAQYLLKCIPKLGYVSITIYYYTSHKIVLLMF